MKSNFFNKDDLVINSRSSFGFNLSDVIDDNFKDKELYSLSVPAGLFTLNKFRENIEDHEITKKGGVIDNGVYESLLSAVEVKQDKKNKKNKTRRGKVSNKITTKKINTKKNIRKS